MTALICFISHITGYFVPAGDLSANSQRREVRREGKWSRHKRQHYSPADPRYIPP